LKDIGKTQRPPKGKPTPQLSSSCLLVVMWRNTIKKYAKQIKETTFIKRTNYNLQIQKKKNNQICVTFVKR
jgi:hypothetical protein